MIQIVKSLGIPWIVRQDAQISQTMDPLKCGDTSKD
jgi:hypothetical protein